MKKIVISALLMGLFGLAQAQTTIGGTIRYDMNKADGATTTSGISRSRIELTSVEQLGGGTTVTAKVGIDGAGRNETVSGTDASVAVAGKFGSVMAGQIELANGIIDRAYGGAPVMGADGTVLAAKGNADIVKYSAPAIGGFTASVSGTRAIDSSADHSYTVGLTGKVGPMNTGVDYNEATKRVRASAMATVAGVTIGAGLSRNETSVADSWAVGASIPVGALTIGAAYSNGNGKASEVGASYALSKRTNVQLAYMDITNNSTSAVNVATTRVRLQHSF